MMTGTEKQIAYAEKCIAGLKADVEVLYKAHEDRIAQAEAEGREKRVARYTETYKTVKEYQEKVLEYADSLTDAGKVIDSFKDFAYGDRISESHALYLRVLGLSVLGLTKYDLGRLW